MNMTNDEIFNGFDALLLEVLDDLGHGLPNSLSSEQREAIEAHFIRVIQAAREGVDDFGRHLEFSARIANGACRHL